MARRSDHTPEELKRLAIKAGRYLIERNGFAKFSARAVAARIGYTVGTLYHIFGTLDDFILHINAATLDEFYQSLTASITRRSSHPLQNLAKSYVTFCRTNFHLWEALFAHRLAKQRELPEWYAPKLARIFSVVEETLIPYVSGERGKRERAAKLLWAGIHGICVLSLSGKLAVVKAESADVLVRELVEVFILGQA